MKQKESRGGDFEASSGVLTNVIRRKRIDEDWEIGGFLNRTIPSMGTNCK